MSKSIYEFGNGKSDGNASMKDLLGGKGANLAEMCLVGIPVPLGFTITTEICNEYYANDKNLPSGLEEHVEVALKNIEQKLDLKLGDVDKPLLVSVRSGAQASMPGMMDTILNLGLNDQTVKGLAKNSNDERFAYDSYRRFIQMYSDVVLGINYHNFEEILDDKKLDLDVTKDTDLTADDLKELVEEYKAKVKIESGRDFPQDTNEQLWGAIKAVFDSWMNNRAVIYRNLHNIPSSWGTAVNIQSMVFGNMGEDSATGVAFTRSPSTGEKYYYGEFLLNAQGEDVVAGIRTPNSINEIGKEQVGSNKTSMEKQMPEIYKQLTGIFDSLEKHYKDMQDIEFTVQRGKLWILQTRSGKRTGRAALKTAVDMVEEGLITKEEALLRIDPNSLDQLLHPTIDLGAKYNVINKALPASPGAASGKIVFSANDALREAEHSKVILVRSETSPEDIHGMDAAVGILTSRGGMTSHAAVVARGMGKPCIVGAHEIIINHDKKTLVVGSQVVKEGDVISLNGSTGEVILGEVPTVEPDLSGPFAIILNWANEYRKLKVRTNAETKRDANTARKFGAEGIGLCRTEHMFFDRERIIAVREMILATDSKGRKSAIDKLLPMQTQDFIDVFEAMEGLPVTIRLLDPPLHEFLPHTEAELADVAEAAGVNVEHMKNRAEQLKELNPMLGHRGCRLGISHPEVYQMQARAIFQALVECKKKNIETHAEIMVPLILSGMELKIIKEEVDKIAEEISKQENIELDYIVGTMIELPRAAICADEIAEYAEFFSFGTNDLTQTTMGISRDDASSFMHKYREMGIFEQDPFATLDEKGVGELMRMAVERGRQVNPKIKLGICGEHGGDPAAIKFCSKLGLDYVSCSPYRVPIAILAAAQAALEK